MLAIFVKSQSQMSCGSLEVYPCYYFEIPHIKKSERQKSANESARLFTQILLNLRRC